MTLDHLIAVVPDLAATHRRLLGMGFDEAWPPGPFWPSATTSGIALGGVNLELYEGHGVVGPLGFGFEPVARPSIGTLVLAPDSLDEGRALLSGMAFEEREKVEPDPSLLALRGFPPEMARETQGICTNLLPADPPYPFFLCLYAPFLRARLAPSNFAVPRGPVVGLSLTAADPEAVRRLFEGRLGSLRLEVTPGPCEVLGIRFTDGSSLSAKDL